MFPSRRGRCRHVHSSAWRRSPGPGCRSRAIRPAAPHAPPSASASRSARALRTASAASASRSPAPPARSATSWPSPRPIPTPPRRAAPASTAARWSVFGSREEREQLAHEIRVRYPDDDQQLWIGLVEDGGAWTWDDGRRSPTRRRRPSAAVGQRAARHAAPALARTCISQRPRTTRSSRTPTTARRRRASTSASAGRLSR